MALPALHGRFLEEVLPRIERDERIVAVAAAGSIANGRPDEHSDVDLVLAVEDDRFDSVLPERIDLVRSWTPLVAAFTGEHVGEPRLIIAVVGPPLLHVDFKFVRVSDVGDRVDGLRVLWERDGRLSAVLAGRPPRPPQLDLQWIEDRFWVWVHYAATKLARGELFEVVGFLAFLRETVLGPLTGHREGRLLQGVRRFEALDPERAEAMRATVCGYDRDEAGRALLACVDLYLRWSAASGLPFDRNRDAQALAVAFLENAVGREDDGAR
ncbi:nucleotidyltransferase domain-containing protein [Glycomyces harbinensis]|uniref:Polymerase nucleotidyl transferase domain-containing protein n=1 Tax=Glycomyces harbinensis TaxID=58114 RepID=A0A1G6XYZ2_9ACTN|nr:nucleotidyltransferase domain-containing protein [Glycomyces harbinensis]SDD83262.1 hypothetical protein SAMN05216270_10832 [Glycomyces harbinensis]